MTGSHPLIVGLGEALYDLLTAGPALGGAPLNAAAQSHNSAITPWWPAASATTRLAKRCSTTWQARHGHELHPTRPRRPDRHCRDHPSRRRPEYEIIGDTAWDRLAWDESLADLAKRCDAVCFGTLGQRLEPARSTIQKFVAAASQTVRLFDLNLRQDISRLSCSSTAAAPPQSSR